MVIPWTCLGNDHLDRVLTAAARMNGMIDAILAQAQLAAEPLQRVSIDLSALAQEIGVELLASVNADGVRAELLLRQGCARTKPTRRWCGGLRTSSATP